MGVARHILNIRIVISRHRCSYRIIFAVDKCLDLFLRVYGYIVRWDFVLQAFVSRGMLLLRRSQARADIVILF